MVAGVRFSERNVVFKGRGSCVLTKNVVLLSDRRVIAMAPWIALYRADCVRATPSHTHAPKPPSAVGMPRGWLYGQPMRRSCLLAEESRFAAIER